MGREVERAAAARGHAIARVFDVDNNRSGGGITLDTLAGVDVCIEFSAPEAVLANIAAVARCGVNMVVGTTGWHDNLDDVRTIVQGAGTGLLYAANFSLGVNLGGLGFLTATTLEEMLSAVEAFRAPLLGLIMTGMGKDGSKGTSVIAAAGGAVIAQDEVSSVVWGMPGASALTGLCSAILPIDEIAPKIVKLIHGDRF
jgi:hypothetical protein